MRFKNRCAHSPTPSDARWPQSSHCFRAPLLWRRRPAVAASRCGVRSQRRSERSSRCSYARAACSPLAASSRVASAGAHRSLRAATQTQTLFSAVWPLLLPAVQLAADLVGPQALDSDGAQRAAGARLATALFEALDLLLERTQPSSAYIEQLAFLQGCYSLASRVLQAHMGFSSATRVGDFAGAAPSVSSHLRDCSAPSRWCAAPRAASQTAQETRLSVGRKLLRVHSDSACSALSRTPARSTRRCTGCFSPPLTRCLPARSPRRSRTCSCARRNSRPLACRCSSRSRRCSPSMRDA